MTCFDPHNRVLDRTTMSLPIWEGKGRLSDCLISILKPYPNTPWDCHICPHWPRWHHPWPFVGQSGLAVPCHVSCLGMSEQLLRRRVGRFLGRPPRRQRSGSQEPFPIIVKPVESAGSDGVPPGEKRRGNAARRIGCMGPAMNEDGILLLSY